jgi:O-antigen/teichoic acid export membrane protein
VSPPHIGHSPAKEVVSRLISNSVWLFAEQFLRMALALATGVWIARYLGPERFGYLSFAIAMVGFVGSLTSMGMNAVVVREVSRAPAVGDCVFGTAFVIRALGAVAGVLFCVGLSFWGSGERLLVAIIGLGLIFQAFDVLDLAFQVKRNARVSAWVRMAAAILSSAIKIVLILVSAPIYAFALAIVIELALCAAGWLVAASYYGVDIRRWTFVRAKGALLMKESWLLAVAGIAIYAQAYADQLIIGTMLGAADLGQYAAAMRWIAVTSFVPLVVQTIAGPEIALAKTVSELSYKAALLRMYRAMMFLFLATAIPLALLGPILTTWLYGHSYAEAASLLPLLALRQFFANFGTGRAMFITNDRLFGFSVFTAVSGCILNIGLNLVLVPQMGIRGAIVASMVSFTFTTFGLEWLNTRARVNVGIMLRAAAFPWRSTCN